MSEVYIEMKGYTILFFFLFTFVVSNNTNAQVARNLYDKPLNELSTVQKQCLDAGFGLSVFGDCMYERQLPWAAFGGGWRSTLRWSNTKLGTSLPGGVTLGYTLLTKDGKQFGGYEQDNRSTQGAKPVGGVWWPLMPGESVEADFLYPAVSPDKGKTFYPDPDTLAVGSVWLEYTTPGGPDALRDLMPSSLTFKSVDSTGAFRWNATEDEAPASEYWVSQISESVDKTDWKNVKTTSAAICNPTEAPIFVDIELRDQNGTFVAKTSLYLKVHETNAFLFKDLFGDQMFPGGKDFTGTVTFSRRETGVLNPGEFQGFNIVIFQVVGDSMGSLKAYPVKK